MLDRLKNTNKWAISFTLLIVILALVITTSFSDKLNNAELVDDNEIKSVNYAEDAENIIFVTVDTLRHDHLQCYGYHIETAPNICDLKDDSYFFEKAYTPSSWTRLSMNSYNTGIYPYRIDSSEVRSENLEDVKTLPEILSEDYETTTISNLDFRYASRGGYENDIYYDVNLTAENMIDKQVKSAKDVLQNNSNNFLHIHSWGPHHPNFPHEHARLDNESIEFYNGIQDKSRHPGYDADIYQTDKHLRKLIEFLKSEDMYEDSLIIFTSDHGEGLRDHGYGGHGKTLYEEEIRVPLLIKPPYSIDSETIEERKEVLGVFEEIIQFSSINRKSINFENSLDSEPILNTGKQVITSFTDQHGHPPNNYMYTFIKNDMKYIRANNSWEFYEEKELGEGIHGGRKETYQEINWEELEVYNLNEDPLEQNNLGIEAFNYDLDKLRKDSNLVRFSREEYNKDIKERLEDLGYIP